MKTLLLKRVAHNEDGTYGVLIEDRKILMLTLEESWKGNQRNISCIPDGSYICKRVMRPIHGETFEVQNVPGRSAILFHSGNTEADTEGCILVGMEPGRLYATDDDTGEAEYQPAVLKSRDAFKLFMLHMKQIDTFYLDIVWA